MPAKSKPATRRRRRAPTPADAASARPAAPALERLRVVLVRPEFAGNIGSTARAMANFAAGRLVLVAPRAATDDPQARALAAHGAPVLAAARVVPTLPDALADCTAVVGTTARAAGLYRGQALVEPRAALAELAGRARTEPVALVLGPEDRGLTNDEAALCSRLITLPASAEYPVLNLAQAAAVCLYELHRAATEPPARHDGTSAGDARAACPDDAPASFAHRERMFARLKDALTRVGFLFGPNPDHLMFALRHLIHRADPTATEADILIGLARQIRWYVDHHPRRPAGKDDAATERGAMKDEG
jgi:tRNA/rRNA methyltransferase